jgi:hypothetical protein
VSDGRYVYAIVPAEFAGDPGTGIDDRALGTVTDDAGVAAVVHRHPDPPYLAEHGDVERRVLEHGEVVDRLWQACATVLPVGFNVIVAGEPERSADAQLRGWLTENGPRLRQRLDALHDHVELRIDIALDQHLVGEAASSTDDLSVDRSAGVQRLLRRRRQQRDRELADRLADELHPEYRRRLAAVSQDVAETRIRRPPAAGTVSVLTLAVLVPTADVPVVGAQLSAIQEEQPAARIRFLGPWPPYSFTDLPDVPH